MFGNEICKDLVQEIGSESLSGLKKDEIRELAVFALECLVCSGLSSIVWVPINRCVISTCLASSKSTVLFVLNECLLRTEVFLGESKRNSDINRLVCYGKHCLWSILESYQQYWNRGNKWRHLWGSGQLRGIKCRRAKNMGRSSNEQVANVRLRNYLVVISFKIRFWILYYVYIVIT